MNRVVIIGTSGSGKTTLGRYLANHLRCSFIELDSLYWNANWQGTEVLEFQQKVSLALQDKKWIVDGNYGSVREIVWRQADTLIWLDYSKWRVIYQVLYRTFGRLFKRKKLWNGNQETWKLTFSKDSVILWSWQSYKKNKIEFPKHLLKPEAQHLQVLHFKSPKQTKFWLSKIN